MHTVKQSLQSPKPGTKFDNAWHKNNMITADRGSNRQQSGRSTSVLLIAAYFLALASVAVVAVGGQFPWFTLAPATVLGFISYFRYVEAATEREQSR